MKQKYYLRGLGIGILITALVFIFTGPSELSEEEIIKRAEALGYTKSEDITPSIGIKELLDNETPTPKPTNTPVPTETPTPEPINTPVPTETPTPEPTSTPVPTETPTPEPTNTPVPTETTIPTPTQAAEPTKSPESNIIKATIVVERGNTATVVCNKIEDAGILEDGKVLREYLVNNGLTDYINIGTYSLSSDMSIKEIAEILTKH